MLVCRQDLKTGFDDVVEGTGNKATIDFRSYVNYVLRRHGVDTVVQSVQSTSTPNEPATRPRISSQQLRRPCAVPDCGQDRLPMSAHCKQHTNFRVSPVPKTTFAAARPARKTSMELRKISQTHRNLVKELVFTEETYLEGLKTLVDVFVVPLREQASDKRFSVKEGTVKSLILNIPQLHQLHSGLLVELQAAADGNRKGYSVNDPYNLLVSERV